MTKKISYVVTIEDDNSQQKIGNIDNKFKALGASALQASYSMAAVSASLSAAGAYTLKLAADAEETKNKFNAVYGEMSDRAQQFAEDLGMAVGRNVSDLQNGMAAYQGFAVGMGFAEEKAFAISTKLQELSLDFASFNNLSDGEAQQRFISAMAGSGQVLDMFGINVKQAAIDQKLLDLGLAKSAVTATEQQKTIARLAIIMEAMSDQGAVGDAVKTAESFTNQLKRLTSDLKTVGEEIGQQLIPIVKEWLKEGIKMLKWFRDLSPEIKENIVQVGLWTAGITGAVGSIGLFIRAISPMITLLKATATAFGVVTTTAGGAAAGIKAFAVSLGPLIAILGAATIAAKALIAQLRAVAAAQAGMNSAIDANIANMESQIKSNEALTKSENAKVKEFGNLRNKQIMIEQDLQNAIRLGNTEQAESLRERSNNLHQQLLTMSKDVEINTAIQATRTEELEMRTKAATEGIQNAFDETSAGVGGNTAEMDKFLADLADGMETSSEKAGGAGKEMKKIADEIQRSNEKIADQIQNIREAEVDEMVRLSRSYKDSLEEITNQAKSITENFAREAQDMVDQINNNLLELDRVRDDINKNEIDRQNRLAESFVNQQEKIDGLIDRYGEETKALEKLNIEREKSLKKLDEDKQASNDVERVKDINERIKETTESYEERIRKQMQVVNETEALLQKEQSAYEKFADLRGTIEDQIDQEKANRALTDLERNVTQIEEQATLRREELEKKQKELEEENEIVRQQLEKRSALYMAQMEELQKQRKKDMDNYENYLKMREAAYARHVSRLKSQIQPLGGTLEAINPGINPANNENNSTVNNNTQSANVNISGVTINNGQDAQQFQQSVTDAVSEAFRQNNNGIPATR